MNLILYEFDLFKERIERDRGECLSAIFPEYRAPLLSLSRNVLSLTFAFRFVSSIVQTEKAMRIKRSSSSETYLGRSTPSRCACISRISFVVRLAHIVVSYVSHSRWAASW